MKICFFGKEGEGMCFEGFLGLFLKGEVWGFKQREFLKFVVQKSFGRGW